MKFELCQMSIGFVMDEGKFVFFSGMALPYDHMRAIKKIYIIIIYFF